MYKLMRHIILNVIIGKAKLYPQEFHLKKNFCAITYQHLCCCFLGKLRRDPMFEKRTLNMRTCELIIEEKMNLQNYIHDSMDFHAMRQLMVKSRHKILMPMLVINLTRTKQKAHSGGYKSSFSRNIHERIDNPVFSVEDAVKELNNELDINGNPKSGFELLMDEFFLMHLSSDIVDINKKPDQFELNEDNIRANIRNAKNEAYNKVKTAQNFGIPRVLSDGDDEGSVARPLKVGNKE